MQMPEPDQEILARKQADAGAGLRAEHHCG